VHLKFRMARTKPSLPKSRSKGDSPLTAEIEDQGELSEAGPSNGDQESRGKEDRRDGDVVVDLDSHDEDDVDEEMDEKDGVEEDEFEYERERLENIK
jgi:hypothetical protein